MILKKRKIKYATIFFICWFVLLVFLVDGVLKFQTLVDYFGSYTLVEISLLLLVILPTTAVYKLTKEKLRTMTIQEFRDYMASGKPVIGGSDVHMMFHQLSQEALKITAEINGKYHTPEQLHDLLEQLWGREVPKTVGMFPPFHTDCGKTPLLVKEYSSTWAVSSRIRVASPSTRVHS